MIGKRILIEIGHPAHVHHFKHLYWDLGKQGWTGLFVTKDKECAIDLLKAYNLPYRVLGVNKKGIARKILSLPQFSLKMIGIARGFKPDIFVSRVSPLSGYASFVMRKPHITFTDTENVKLLDSISQPFATVILTSTSYYREHGRKQLRYPGYHELAYLHPRRFTPDPGVMQLFGVTHETKYALVRFVNWDAHHDIGHKGFSYDNKIKLIRALESSMRVFISSESELPDSLRSYSINIPAERMHDVLYYAQLFVGESATMASESAVLGTPAVYVNSSQLGYTNDLARYALLFSFTDGIEDQKGAMSKVKQLTNISSFEGQFRKNHEELLSHSMDVSAFMVWFVSHYPSSVYEVKQTGFSFDQFGLGLVASHSEKL